MEYVEERGDFVLRHGEDCCVLERYRGSGGTVILPEDVTEIGSFAFHQCIGLTGVTILTGVTVIGRGAFRGCARLAEVSLPAGLEEIGPMAFHCCASLARIDIPQGVRELGAGAFQGCLDLKNLALPRGIRRIGGHLLGPLRKSRVDGMVPLLMEGCRIDPATLEELLDIQWTGEDDFFEVAAVYLRSGRKDIMERTRARLCADTAWAAEVLADLLTTYPTARGFSKGAAFVKHHAPGLWPETFQTFCALARTAGRRKALRRLEALWKDPVSPGAE